MIERQLSIMGNRGGEVYFLEALAVYRKINLEVDSKSVQFFASAFTNFPPLFYNMP